MSRFMVRRLGDKNRDQQTPAALAASTASEPLDAWPQVDFEP